MANNRKSSVISGTFLLFVAAIDFCWPFDAVRNINQCISNVRKCVCNDIPHVSMRKRDKNSPRTTTCDDFLASTIAISGVRCYTVIMKTQFCLLIIYICSSDFWQPRSAFLKHNLNLITSETTFKRQIAWYNDTIDKIKWKGYVH